jgi:hypothetical protein
VGDIISFWWAASFRFGGRHRQESATYDDLLRRLDNIIASLHSRSAAQNADEVDETT